MNLVGRSETHKADAARLLDAAIGSQQRLVTSAQVLQEILHRYVAIKRLDAIQPAFDALLGVVDEVVAIEEDDVMRARNLVVGAKGLSARDALYVAVMLRQGISRVISFDADFDRVPEIVQLGA